MSAHFEILKHPHQGLAAVKHGFSWPAAVLGWAWAFGRKLWVPALALLVVHAVLALIATKLISENSVLLIAIGVSLQAIFGARANYLLSRAYQERGFDYRGLVPATSASDAIAKFKAVGENAPAEWRLGVAPALFNVPTDLRQILAIARLTIKAVVRYRLLPVLAVLLVLAALAIWWVDETRRGIGGGAILGGLWLLNRAQPVSLAPNVVIVRGVMAFGVLGYAAWLFLAC